MAFKPLSQTVTSGKTLEIPSSAAVFNAIAAIPSGANTALSNLSSVAINTALLGTLGAVGAPAYSFTGDTNTGMWSSGADTLNLSTGGSERIRVDSSGNVGVGTNSPQSRLNVSGGWPQLRIDSSGNEAGLLLYNSNVWTGGMYTDVAGANVRVIASTGRDLRLLAGSSTGDNGEVMRCTSSGRVGIGTTTPTVKLDIVGDIQASGNATLNGGLLTLNSANGVVMNNSGFKGAFQFVTDNIRLSAGTGVGIRFTTDSSNGEVNERMRITSAGNVGIGTNTPAQKLDVSGNIQATSGDVMIATAGKGLKVKEGTNAKMGVATLVAGTVTVSTTAVSATSRIFITVQALGTITAPVAVAVTARTANTSFTITSADNTDTSDVAWMIVDPA